MSDWKHRRIPEAQFFGLYLEKLIITDALFSAEIELDYLNMEN